MGLSIAYLVPEFPGQTHIFFWRELKELHKLGVDVSLASTTPPPRAIVSHTWSGEAAGRTFYAVPQRKLDWLRLVRRAMLRPVVTARAIGDILKGQFQARDRLRMVGAMLAGINLAGHMSKRNIRHVHAHSAGGSADIAMFAARYSGGTFSLTLHGPLSDYGHNQDAKWREARFGFVITSALRRDLVEHLHVPTEKLDVVAMGVDLEAFQRTERYEPFDSSRPLRIFSCGRLNYVKGHQDLIQAVSLVKQAGLAVELIIAGEDEQGGRGFRRVLERQVEDLGLSETVALLGAVPESRIISELQKAHVFVLASHNEPLGVAIMEAMALEVPVIATRAGGVTELITDPSEGILVTPQNPQELSEALVALAKDSDLATVLGAQGGSRARSHFGAHVSARALFERCRALGTA